MTPDGISRTTGPAVTTARCMKCHRLTAAPIPVRWIQTTSGPGATLWACPDHAPEVAPGPMPGEVPTRP